MRGNCYSPRLVPGPARPRIVAQASAFAFGYGVAGPCAVGSGAATPSLRRDPGAFGFGNARISLVSWLPLPAPPRQRPFTARRQTHAGRFLLFALLTLAAAACGPRPPAGLRQLHLCSGDEGPADAYCGSLTVFENRQTNTGRHISLAIVVLPALNDDYRADPLFFLAGGPGQGAATMASLVKTAFAREPSALLLSMCCARF